MDGRLSLRPLPVIGRTRNCSHVWVVYVTCDGETDVAGLYDSKEAAEVHRDWQNSQRRYYGRASISRMPILNLELARRRFTPESRP